MTSVLEPGIYRGISFTDYQKIPAINKSSLDYLTQSPAHLFRAVFDPNRVIEDATPAMKLGNAIHTAILEPERFAAEFVCEPKDAPRRPTSAQLKAKKPSEDTLAQILFWENFETAHKGKIILSSDDYDLCLLLKREALGHPVTELLKEGGFPEVTIVWRDPIEDVLCKGRLDWYTPGIILDWKSVEDASLYEFQKKISNFDWETQAAWYVDGLKQLGEDAEFIFGALEKPTQMIAFYSATPEMLDVGRKQYRKHLQTYAECLKTWSWPGYPKEIRPISPAPWKMKNAKEVMEF